MRLFIGVWPDENVAAAVKGYKKGLARSVSGIRWVGDGKEHFTIRFLGETPRESAGAVESALGRAAKKVDAFTAEVGGLVLLPSPRRIRVIALGLISGGEEMRALFDAVEDELARDGFERETRAFRAHMTLGRAKRRGPGSGLRAPEEEFGEMLVDELRLVESVLSNEGVSYTPVARIRLGSEE